MAITRSSDYIKEINKLFPEVSEKDIKKIMEYGWRQLYLLNSYGGDTIITDKTFWMYVGKLTPDSFRHFRYYCRKLATRIRILYKRKRIPWDGYYFFINENEFLGMDIIILVYLSVSMKNTSNRKTQKDVLERILNMEILFYTR